MSGKLAACLAVASLVIMHTTTADAATLKRSLPCSAIYFIFGALTGSTNSSAVFIKNTGSAAISAGTVYTYTIPAGTFHYTDPDALGAGETLRVADARVTDTGTCTASVPGIVLKQLNLQLNKQLTLNPG
jgi:hypothetical protein